MQFTGRENDGIGLYHYRSRFYHPGLHRFISEDPARLAGGGPNFYAYVLNNPTNFEDPLGLNAIDWLMSHINWNYVPGICNADSFRFYGGGLDNGKFGGGAFRLDNVHYSNGPNGWGIAGVESGWLFEVTRGAFGGGVITDLSGRKPKEGLFLLQLTPKKLPFELGLLLGYSEDGLALGYYGDAGSHARSAYVGVGGGWSATFSSVATCLRQMQ